MAEFEVCTVELGIAAQESTMIASRTRAIGSAVAVGANDAVGGAGGGGLADALEDFASRWKAGVNDLAHTADKAAQALTSGMENYDDNERATESSMNPAG